jgi:hypothetical protein
MAKNFFGNSWNEFDTPFNNSGPLTDRPSRLRVFFDFKNTTTEHMFSTTFNSKNILIHGRFMNPKTAEVECDQKCR